MKTAVAKGSANLFQAIVHFIHHAKVFTVRNLILTKMFRHKMAVKLIWSVSDQLDSESPQYWIEIPSLFYFVTLCFPKISYSVLITYVLLSPGAACSFRPVLGDGLIAQFTSPE